MPLRDHFHPPAITRHTWDSFHGMWPAMIVRQLFDILPAGYVAAPTVHFGKDFEIDVCTFERARPDPGDVGNGKDGGATALSPQPTLTLEADLVDRDEFEVQIFSERRGQLVAAIGIVSPSNKDRPEARRAFLTKAQALLQKGVCVSVVDLVTDRHANLYAELLDEIGGVDPQLDVMPQLYAVTVRSRPQPARRSLLDVWFYPMTLGEPLPTLPVWLDTDLRVLLPLEASYEETCRLLHIG